MQNDKQHTLVSESRKPSELVFTSSDTPKCVHNVYKTTPIYHWVVGVAMTILIEKTSENKTYDRRRAFRSTVRCCSEMLNLIRNLLCIHFFLQSCLLKIQFPKLNHVGQLVGYFGNVAKQCYLQVDIFPDSKMYLSVAGLTRTSATFACRWFEQLSSSTGWRVTALQTFAKKWRRRHFYKIFITASRKENCESQSFISLKPIRGKAIFVTSYMHFLGFGITNSCKISCLSD